MKLLTWSIENNFPNSEGVYLVRGIFGEYKSEEIDVYIFAEKGLCCFIDEFTFNQDIIDFPSYEHVSVQNTGLDFITKLRNFDKNAVD